jgi:hypothetical protein
MLIMLFIAFALCLLAYSMWVDPDDMSPRREDGSRISELRP